MCRHHGNLSAAVNVFADNMPVLFKFMICGDVELNPDV